MYLLRHGQSLFNLHYTETHKDPGIEDPVLTPLGQAQAEAAAELLADKPITRIIVSPYTRALQTAEPVLTRLRLPAEVMHEVRERFAFACDIGSHRDLLAERFPHQPIRPFAGPLVAGGARDIRGGDCARGLVSRRNGSARGCGHPLCW